MLEIRHANDTDKRKKEKYLYLNDIMKVNTQLNVPVEKEMHCHIIK
jgi:hypothetical protein